MGWEKPHECIDTQIDMISNIDAFDAKATVQRK